MNQNRTRNSLLAVIAALLLLNFGVTVLSPSAHAQGKAQYKVMETTPSNLQELLNKESEQGFEYVDSVGVRGHVILRKR